MSVLSDKQFAAVSVGALAVGFLAIYASKGLIDKTAKAVGNSVVAAGNAVNPASEKNLIYKGVNAIGDVFDDGGDNDSFSLGSWAYDWVN